MDESAKAKVRIGIVAGFDRHAQRYYEQLFEALDSGSRESSRKAYEKAFLEQSFLVKRTVSPGFDRYVLNRVRASPMIKRQRRTILKACLIPILRPDGIYIDEVVAKSNEPSDNNKAEGYTRRHVQRLFHSHFPETFFKAKEEATRTLGDQRFTPFHSIFSTRELPKTSKSELAADYYKREYGRLMTNGEEQTRILLNYWVRLVTPEFLESILSFRDECVGVVDEVGRLDDRVGFFSDEINSFSVILL